MSIRNQPNNLGELPEVLQSSLSMQFSLLWSSSLRFLAALILNSGSLLALLDFPCLQHCWKHKTVNWHDLWTSLVCFLFLGITILFYLMSSSSQLFLHVFVVLFSFFPLFFCFFILMFQQKSEFGPFYYILAITRVIFSCVFFDVCIKYFF